VRLVLLEPFLLPVKAEQAAWREDLDPKIAVVRKLAAEFGATFLPMDGSFAVAAAARPAAEWAADGVHPTLAGHALLARQWLQAARYRLG
jgi:acyl-CoA thioesterase-1